MGRWPTSPIGQNRTFDGECYGQMSSYAVNVMPLSADLPPNPHAASNAARGAC